MREGEGERERERGREREREDRERVIFLLPWYYSLQVASSIKHL